jgi:A/G-specific adenine glycosylase
MIGSVSNFARKLRRWFDQNHRDLPWRLPDAAGEDGKINPYKVLVSEAMLQQTQVATVIPYFHQFIMQFPNLQALAEADTQAVLRAWQGLGYYSRARNLQKAAVKILTDFAGKIPCEIEDLLQLPGVGRYTAGAVSSIAFERRSPILDGNVARVLCRIDAVRTDPREPATREKLWERAQEILPSERVGDFNSALMELGALICTPRSPQCLLCPVRDNCAANAAGIQEKIPPPKPVKQTPLLERWTFCIHCGEKFLVEQRPAKGRWAGMWQFATLEPRGISPSAALLRLQYKLRVTEPVVMGSIEHALTHRRYRFHAFSCSSRDTSAGMWASLEELNDRPMPKPHLRIRNLIETQKS